jgi:hypothetical protein
MSQRLFVTLGSRCRKDRMILELPGDRPVRELIPDLIKVAGWKELAGVSQNAFFLETEEGERLSETCTLHEADISSFNSLFLVYMEKQGIRGRQADEEADLQGLERKKDSVERAEALSPLATKILQQPHLMGPGGLIFPIHQSPVTIGRSGKGSAPDIDLSEWDSAMIISRRHAVIETRGDGLSLMPEKTTNGTFINGVEVPAGESRMLRDEDRIQFGFTGLELVIIMAERNGLTRGLSE